MPLSNEQIKSLLGLVANVESDSMDCDSCFGRVAEFAEINLKGAEIPEAFRDVEAHMRQCPCCKDEYEALLAGLRGLDFA